MFKTGPTLELNDNLTKGMHGDDSGLKRGRFCMPTPGTEMRNQLATNLGHRQPIYSPIDGWFNQRPQNPQPTAATEYGRGDFRPGMDCPE